MSSDADDTGVPAPQVQNLLEKVDIDESVAACESKVRFAEPRHDTELTSHWQTSLQAQDWIPPCLMEQAFGPVLQESTYYSKMVPQIVFFSR